MTPSTKLYLLYVVATPTRLDRNGTQFFTFKVGFALQPGGVFLARRAKNTLNSSSVGWGSCACGGIAEETYRRCRERTEVELQ